MIIYILVILVSGGIYAETRHEDPVSQQKLLPDEIRDTPEYQEQQLEMEFDNQEEGS